MFRSTESHCLGLARSLRPLLAAALLSMVAADALAQVDRDHSTLCPIACPAGDGAFVALNDANGNPVPGVTVTLDYSNPVVKDVLEWCDVPPQTGYTAVTTGDGKAFFAVEAGFRAPAGVATLLFGAPWDPDEPAPGFDLDGNRVVDEADRTIILDVIQTSAYHFAADYDCNGLVNLVDYAIWSQHLGHVCDTTATGSVPRALDRSIHLAPAHPNPSSSRVTVAYSLAGIGWVRLSVYDVSGRLVVRLIDRFDVPGEHTTTWDGRSRDGNPVASGLYRVRLESLGQSVSRWVVISR